VEVDRARLSQLAMKVGTHDAESHQRRCDRQESKSLTTDLDVVEGMQLDRGYISPYFITDNERMVVEFENLILLTDKKISTIQDLIPVWKSRPRRSTVADNC